MVGDRGRGVVVAGDSIAHEVGRTAALRGCTNAAQDGSRLRDVVGQVAWAAATLGEGNAPDLILVCAGANDGGDVVRETKKHASRIVAAVQKTFNTSHLVFLRPGWSGSVCEVFSLQAARTLEAEGCLVKDIDGDGPTYGISRPLVAEGAWATRATKRRRTRDRKGAEKNSLHYLPQRAGFLDAQIAGIIKAVTFNLMK